MKLYVLKIDGFVTDIGYFPDRISKSNVEKPIIFSPAMLYDYLIHVE